MAGWRAVEQRGYGCWHWTTLGLCSRSRGIPTDLRTSLQPECELAVLCYAIALSLSLSLSTASLTPLEGDYRDATKRTRESTRGSPCTREGASRDSCRSETSGEVVGSSGMERGSTLMQV